MPCQKKEIRYSHSSTRSIRRGISVLESIGAIAAVSAGVWLGAMYLGIDLREAWNLAAEQTGLEQFEIDADVNKQAANESEGALDESSNAERDAATATASEETPADADVDGKLQAEIDQIRKALQQLEQKKNATGESPTKDVRPQQQQERKQGKEVTKAKIGRSTLAYWNRVNDIMLEEEQMRQSPAGGLTPGNAGSFLAGRGTASQFAWKSIHKLSTKNVDPIVANLARDIADWYKRGQEINDKATYLFTEADPSARRGPLGKSWKAAEKQHRKEVELINRRGDAVRSQMTSKYGLAFPDLR